MMIFKLSMGRKKTNEEIEETYTSSGCILLTKEYNGQYTKLEFLCICEQKDIKTYKDFRNTPRCNFKNHGERLEMKKKGIKILKLKIVSSEGIQTNDIIQQEASDQINSRKWNKLKLISEGDAIHGKGKINYDRVTEVKTGKKFELQCNICTYIWSTELKDFIHKKHPNGCGWCKDELANIRIFSLYIIQFIGSRIHNDRYIYELVDGKEITTSSDPVKVICRISNHSFVVEKIIDHLNKYRLQIFRCDQCEIQRKQEIGRKGWYHDLDRFIKEAEKIHKKGTYDYSFIKPEDIVNMESELNIICKRLKYDGSICEKIFRKSIRSHINNQTGCPDCLLKVKYNLRIFLKRANEVYTENQFSYHLIKEEDIVNCESRLPIVCSYCDRILFKITITQFLNCQSKQCEYCFGLRKWTPERIKEECETKAKEGLYDYSLVEYNKIENCDSVIKVSCIICKNKGYPICDFNPTINNHFNNKSGCPRCSGNMPWDYERVISDIPELFKTEYDYSLVKPEMIEKSSSKIPILHKKCNKIFTRLVDDHIYYMKGCTFCPLSSGAKVVYLYLEKLGIDFDTEVPCPGLGANSYRYDFMIYVGDDIIVIEYDGKGHWFPQEHWGGEETWKAAQKRDIYKHYLTIKEGKKMIRIDYSVANREIPNHIDIALASKEREYFSTPSIYDWLIEGVKNYESQKSI